MSYGEERRIRNLATRATPLWDRHVRDDHQRPVPDLVRAHERLGRWRQILGSAEVLSRRLHSCDFSPQQLDELLGGVQAEAELPSWASTLISVLHLQSSSPDLGELGDLTDRS